MKKPNLFKCLSAVTLVFGIGTIALLSYIVYVQKQPEFDAVKYRGGLQAKRLVNFEGEVRPLVGELFGLRDTEEDLAILDIYNEYNRIVSKYNYIDRETLNSITVNIQFPYTLYKTDISSKYEIRIGNETFIVKSYKMKDGFLKFQYLGRDYHIMESHSITETKELIDVANGTEMWSIEGRRFLNNARYDFFYQITH